MHDDANFERIFSLLVRTSVALESRLSTGLLDGRLTKA